MIDEGCTTENMSKLLGVALGQEAQQFHATFRAVEKAGALSKFFSEIGMHQGPDGLGDLTCKARVLRHIDDLLGVRDSRTFVNFGNEQLGLARNSR